MFESDLQALKITVIQVKSHSDSCYFMKDSILINDCFSSFFRLLEHP